MFEIVVEIFHVWFYNIYNLKKNCCLVTSAAVEGSTKNLLKLRLCVICDVSPSECTHVYVSGSFIKADNNDVARRRKRFISATYTRLHDWKFCFAYSHVSKIIINCFLFSCEFQVCDTCTKEKNLTLFPT